MAPPKGRKGEEEGNKDKKGQGGGGAPSTDEKKEAGDTGVARLETKIDALIEVLRETARD